MSATARLADLLDEPLVRCRYTRRSGEMCTAEALDPNAPVLLCSKHTARLVEHARATYNRYLKESNRG